MGNAYALTREELSLELSRLWQDLGRTALLITHDIEEAILLGDRVIAVGRAAVGLDHGEAWSPHP